VVVAPAYPLNPGWNDYVVNADRTRDSLSQPDQGCAGTEAGGYSACIHSGERRRVALPASFTSCADLAAADELGAFQWACRATGGQVSLFSTGLREGMGLRHLVTASAWKPNRIRVSRAGQLVAESAPAAWWGNPVVPAPDNSASAAAGLPASGTIYTLAASRLSNGYNFTADKVALVTLPGAVLGYGGSAAANAGGFGELMSGSSASERYLIAGYGRKFTWLEGSFDASGSPSSAGALLTAGMAFGVVRGARFANGPVTGNVNGYSYSTNYAMSWREVEVHQATLLTVNLQSRYDSIRVRGGVGWVVRDTGSLFRVRSVNNQAPPGYEGGVGIGVEGARNTFVDCIVANNQMDGVNTYGGHDNTFVGLTVLNNLGGIRMPYGDTAGTTVLNATVANNGYHGIQIYLSGLATLANILAVNNTPHGLSIEDASSVRAYNLAASRNQVSGVGISGTSAQNAFHGTLVVGGHPSGDCAVNATGAAPGLLHGTCAGSSVDGTTSYPGQASTAVLRPNRNAGASFKGKLAADDPANASDQLGLAAFSSIADWFAFLSPFRAWGVDGGAFPSAGNIGRCVSGSCRIWDLRLAASDAVVLNRNGDGANPNSAWVTGGPCPSAVHGARAVTDQQASPRTFLLGATELFDDGSGNDNGLCESGETCLYSPNYGAYQGEGDPAGRSCVFTDGAVTGVRMLSYPVNGA
jgi:hypothetical protein